MAEVVSTEICGRGVTKTTIRVNGVIHCKAGPAITIMQNGRPICYKWYQNGVKHRENGPAVVSNRKDRYKRVWYTHGKMHRKKLPARITVCGSLYIKEWCSDGVLHRIGAPAYIATTNGIITEQRWYLHGKQHRVGEPAVIKYNLRGNVIEKIWMENDQIHREGEHARVSVDRMASTVTYTWYQHGFIHRDENPAVITYNRAGLVVLYRWYQHGKPHRIGAPAYINIYNGLETSARAEMWYVEGILHRDGGEPAVTDCKYGHICGQEWYQHGKQNMTGLIYWYQFGNEYHEVHRESDGSHYRLSHVKFSYKSCDILIYYPPRGEFNKLDNHIEVYTVNYVNGVVVSFTDSRSKWPWLYDILPMPIAEEIEPHLTTCMAYLHKRDMN